MNRFDWLSEYLAELEDEHIIVHSGSAQTLAPAHLLIVDPEDWGKAASVARKMGLRWAGIWADEQDSDIVLSATVVNQGDYVVLRTALLGKRPEVASHTPYFPGADRMERHLADMFGIQFTDHPDPRRWTRHQAWKEDQYPLRADFPVQGTPPARTPADSDYPFAPIQGAGVYEIPVGPVHAGTSSRATSASGPPGNRSCAWKNDSAMCTRASRRSLSGAMPPDWHGWPVASPETAAWPMPGPPARRWSVPAG